MSKINNRPSHITVFPGLGFLPSAIESYLPNGLQYSIVTPGKEEGFSFQNPLSDGVSPAICLGWSLGGKYALDLFLKMPGKFEHIYLLNQAPCWSGSVLHKELQFLRQSSAAEYLHSFYTRCFQGAPEALQTFMDNHYEQHIQTFTSPVIEQQLECLGNYRLEEYLPLGEKITFLHSRHDAIAPLTRMRKYCRDNNLRYHVLSGTRSHFPFNREELWKYILP